MSSSTESFEGVLNLLEELYSAASGSRKNQIVYALIEAQLADEEQLALVRNAIMQPGNEQYPQLNKWLINQENELFSIGGTRLPPSNPEPKEATGFWAEHFSPSCPECHWKFSFKSVPRKKPYRTTCPRCATELTLDRLTRSLNQLAPYAVIPMTMYFSTREFSWPVFNTLIATATVFTVLGYKFERLIRIETPDTDKNL